MANAVVGRHNNPAIRDPGPETRLIPVCRLYGRTHADSIKFVNFAAVMKTGRFLLTAVTAVLSAFSAHSGNAELNENKLKVRPIGTLLIDGALYCSPQKEMFPDGAAIPDVRLGAMASYGKWEAKVEVGMAYGRVGLKDCWLQYSFSPSDCLVAGLQMQQFGYQNSSAACMKVTMFEPISNTIFNEGHMIGLQWIHSADRYFTTLSAHVEPKAATVVSGKDELTQQGYGLRSRLVGRPWHADGRMLQIGFSSAFLSPQCGPERHDAFNFNAMFPTSVCQQSAIGTTVDNAMNLWKFTPELMACYGRAAVESQYFFMQVNRRGGLQPFRASGTYVTLRGLILGSDYSYNMAFAGIDTPAKGSLELVGSYNYTGLSDSKAGIYGGRINDLSAGVNYYFNRYIIGKFRYSYTHRWDRDGMEPVSLSAFQLRLQVLF